MIGHEIKVMARTILARVSPRVVDAASRRDAVSTMIDAAEIIMVPVGIAAKKAARFGAFASA